MLHSKRLNFALIALGCSALLAYGYHLEYPKFPDLSVIGLEPCPMCIFQRLCYFALIGVTGIAAIHNPARLGRQVYGLGATTIALIGASIAARQTWLQHLPPEKVPECGPGLEYMLDFYPIAEVVKKALTGSGECAEVSWTFLRLSIAEWSLLCFVVFALWCFALSRKEKVL